MLVEHYRDWWDCLDGAARTTGRTVRTEHHRLRLAIHRAATGRGVYPADEAAATEVGLLLAADLDPGDAVRRWITEKPRLLAVWRACRTFRAH